MRAGTLATTQLRGAAGDLLAGALGRLEERLRGPTLRERSLERMREVVERDRALAYAEQPASSALPATESLEQHRAAPTYQAETPAQSEPAAPRALEVQPCEEPIRTRTMARLLAAQGHLERALSIYAYLLERNPGDGALLDELAALRASQGST